MGSLDVAARTKQQPQDHKQQDQAETTAAVIANSGAHVITATAEDKKQNNQKNDQHCVTPKESVYTARLRVEMQWGAPGCLQRRKCHLIAREFNVSHEHVQEHIDLIARQEQEFAQQRTGTERVGDAIAGFAGSLHFVVLHLAWFSGWILWNTAFTPHAVRFDPYPFAMLDTIVAMEAILLASFILMRQSRISRRSDEREHLMLQVLLLTEKETTALLQINRELAERFGMHGVAQNEDVAALSRETSIEEVAETIRENLSEEL